MGFGGRRGLGRSQPGHTPLLFGSGESGLFGGRINRISSPIFYASSALAVADVDFRGGEHIFFLNRNSLSGTTGSSRPPRPWAAGPMYLRELGSNHER